MDDEVAALLELDPKPEFGHRMVEYGMEECPYKPGTPEHTQWVRLQTRRLSTQRLFNGESRRETSEMRGKVAADFEAAGYPAGRVVQVSAAMRQVLVQVSVTVDDFNEAMVRLAEKLADSQVLHDLSEELKRLAHQRVPVKTGQLRHGHAAVCPRHGPTTGGFCRRCR